MTSPGVSPGPVGSTGAVPLLVLDDTGDVGHHHGAGDYLRVFNFTDASGTRARYVEWRVPPSYRPADPLPLVFVLHGGSGWGCLMRARTGMDILGAEKGFISAYPAGTSQFSGVLAFSCFWATGHEPKAGHEEFDLIDDVAYIEACIDEISNYFNVDATRVYCCGHSNGGQMTSRMGAASTRLAAVSPVAGHYAPYEQPSQPSQPVNILQFAGKLDPIHLYGGGTLGVSNPVFETFTLEPVGSVIGSWLTYIGGTAKLKTRTAGVAPDTAQGNYYRVPNGAEVGFWTSNNSGHAWPGGIIVPDDDVDVPPLPLSVNASREMWDFFQRHALVPADAGGIGVGGH